MKDFEFVAMVPAGEAPRRSGHHHPPIVPPLSPAPTTRSKSYTCGQTKACMLALKLPRKVARIWSRIWSRICPRICPRISHGFFRIFWKPAFFTHKRQGGEGGKKKGCKKNPTSKNRTFNTPAETNSRNCSDGSPFGKLCRWCRCLHIAEASPGVVINRPCYTTFRHPMRRRSDKNTPWHLIGCPSDSVVYRVQECMLESQVFPRAEF